MRETRNVEGKRPLGRPRRRREDNFKMHLRERGSVRRCILDSSRSEQDQWWALMNTVMNLRVPQKKL
jgi:hypothetical protein